MKVFKSGKDFIKGLVLEPKINDNVIIKQSIATGWGYLAKVVKITKTQVIVEITNLIPTEEKCRFGTINGLKDGRNIEGFFENWSFRKKINVGKKRKFFKESHIEVGSTNDWNPNIICELL